MDEHLFRNVSNQARRRRLLLQHAARIAQEIADVAAREAQASQALGRDPDPILINRSRRLRDIVRAAAEIDDVKRES